jgi:tetratricopeptide (TPR) repeat protein
MTLAGITPFLKPGNCEAASTTVAVLPFENLNQDSTYDVLSRGMCESLITGLSSIQSLTLVERAQVEKALKEQALGLTGAVDEKSAPKTGQLLGAKYVVMGSYQVIGNQVKITARFVNAETGEIDPSKSVSVTGKYPNEVFDLQNQIASKLVTSFNVAASKAETDQMAASLKSPGNFTAYELFVKGRNAMLLGTEAGYQEAVAYYRKAIELKPDYAAVYSNLGSALNHQRKPEEAVAAYRKAIEIQPIAYNYSNLGVALLNQGKYEEAVAAQRKAIELKPNFGAFYDNLGAALQHQGKNEEAMAAHRKAIELDPANASAHYNLGIMLKSQGKNEEAMASYRKAIQFKPDFSEAYNNLGLCLKDEKKYEEAIAAYRKAIDLKPDDPNPYNNLGFALMQLGKDEEAIAALRKTNELKPDPFASFNLGLILGKQGKYEEAIAAFQKTNELRPDASAYFNLGLMFKNQGKTEEAAAAYRKAIELKLDYTFALENLAILLDKKGERKEARVFWERAEKWEKRPDWVEVIKKRLAEKD